QWLGRRTGPHHHHLGVRLQGKPWLGARVPHYPAPAHVPDRSRRHARDPQDEGLGSGSRRLISRRAYTRRRAVTPTPPEGLRMGTPRGRGALLASILGSGMAFLDGTVVNLALPAIGDDLGTGFAG